MKTILNKILIIFIIIFILHFFCSSIFNYWEYETINFKANGFDRLNSSEALEFSSIQINNSILNDYGKDGWEIVDTYLELETAFPNFGNEEYVTGIRENVRSQNLVVILKRKVKYYEQVF